MIRAIVVAALVAGLAKADWKPAQGPLKTRWAKDVAPDNAHPDYPRPQMTRPQWQSLNGLWRVAPAKNDLTPAEDLSVPILVPFPVESALSGVMKPYQRVWYHRKFSLNNAWAGQHVLLHFGAVNWETTLWVNGKKLGEHRGGYDAFTFDITDALKKSGPQELNLTVLNPVDLGQQPRGKQVRKPGGIMYTASTGIWQTVWLEPVPAAHIESLQIVPDVDAGTVHLRIHTVGATADDMIFANVEEQGHRVASAAGAPDQELKIPIAHAKLWSPEHPFLYTLTATLFHRGGRDTVGSYFGMRKISLGKDEHGVTRLFLNNKPYFQVGLLDQGFWPDGLYTAPTDAALKYDIEVSKQLGFNLARKHVKVEPERWYYWCDKLGLLVWQDMPSGDNGTRLPKTSEARKAAAHEFEHELERLIDGRRNHPCIVQWVLFNEGWGQFDTRRLTAWIQKHDPSRLVDNASGWTDRGVGSVHDIHVYPGPGSPKPEEHRAAVLGEFGGLGLPVKGHQWKQQGAWGYRATQDPSDLTRRYEELLRRVYQLKEKHGLSAVVYTQTTDVETESNGLLTYDRAVIKVFPERAAAANRGDFSRMPAVHVVMPTSQEKGFTWRYTFQSPVGKWFSTDFDAHTWKEGPGGFGTKGTPGAVVRTTWNTDDIWLRREVTLPAGKLDDPNLLLHHDEDAEVYINGVLAAKVAGFTTDYEITPLSDVAKATLRPGKNLVAIHCHQTTGGQYIDVGLVDLRLPEAKRKQTTPAQPARRRS